MPSTPDLAARESASALRVLIVDDHVDSADVMAQALELHGHETRVAYDPLSALSVATEFRPQIAILDIHLPTMDGYELGATLRAEFDECRFIALTGNSTGLNCLRSQWAGFHGFLTKPVGLDELLMAVSDARPSGTFTRDAKVDLLFREPVIRRQRERARIDLLESKEVVRYWTTALSCTEAQLRAAVNEVGVNADDVRHHLKKLAD
ncbi:MAG TPA: response regulator [Polyangiaceae bacterium]|nr:response regulator [Polyangiaceae bacterium]